MRIWIWRGVVLCGLLLASAGMGGCGKGTKHGQDSTGNVLSSPGAVVNLPAEVQRIKVTIDHGAFDADRYAVQTGPVQLVVTTQGGPYTLTIKPLVQARTLPADATTPVGLTAPSAGDYAMTLASGGTATLTVRLPGTK